MYRRWVKAHIRLGGILMECMIHACEDRMWYVENYLVPSLQEQGIDSTVWCDNGEGSL